MRALKEYNKYLFFEFGFDVEGYSESEVSKAWPFGLTFLESTEIFGVPTALYEFSDQDVEYVLVDGSSLGFHKKDGLTIDELKRQLLGAAWLGKRHPVKLNSPRIDYQRIPSVPEREKCIQALWEKHFPDESMRILEGLYLQRSKEYIALIESITSDVTAIIGNQIVFTDVQWKQLPVWRRLALGIGTLLQDGALKP